MHVLLFILMVIASFIVVRIGAIFFELTGMPSSIAEFQAISCFTSTGFTTRESEMVAAHAQRRRIASWLMVIGNAGFITLIAAFANSLRSPVFLKLTIPILDKDIPASLLPWVNVLIIIAAIALIYFVFYKTRLASFVADRLKNRWKDSRMARHVSNEELIIATGGYGVSNIHINESSAMIGRSLRNEQLSQAGITVLALERDGHTLPNPPADAEIRLNDRLICFGKLDQIHAALRAHSS